MKEESETKTNFKNFMEQSRIIWIVVAITVLGVIVFLVHRYASGQPLIPLIPFIPSFNLSGNSDADGDEVNCESKKFKVKKVKGDGNCFFRALADQFNRSHNHDTNHRALRKAVHKEVQNNKDAYKDFMTDEDKKMKNDGVHAGHVHIQAAANLLKRELLICKKDGGEPSRIEPKKKKHETGYAFYYDEMGESGHYDSLVEA